MAHVDLFKIWNFILSLIWKICKTTDDLALFIDIKGITWINDDIDIK